MPPNAPWMVTTVGILAFLLWGCATSRPPSSSAHAQPTSSNQQSKVDDQVVELLTYYQHLTALTPEQLEREYALVQQAFLNDGKPPNRLRLALLLSLPNARFHNSDSALDLLNGYLTQAPQDELGKLAYLIAGLVVQQTESDRKLRTYQHRAEMLQQQVEELKSIERSISQRQIPRAPAP